MAPRLTDARGFTMVELLVVILLIGILAGVALPSFLTQRSKAEDTEAQLTLRTVVTALATYETDHDTFDATRSQLTAIEPSIGDASADLAISGTKNAYEISERSGSGTTFTMKRAASQAVERTCSDHGRGRCRAAPDAEGAWW